MKVSIEGGWDCKKGMWNFFIFPAIAIDRMSGPGYTTYFNQTRIGFYFLFWWLSINFTNNRELPKIQVTKKDELHQQ